MSRLSQPAYPIEEIGITELIGADEQVDQDEYSASVGVTIGTAARPVSGEILHVTLYSHESGTGAIQTPAGVLMIFDANIQIAAGAANMTSAKHAAMIAQIPIAAADWKADANGATVSVHNKPVAFLELTDLYFIWLHEDATSYNDGAGDDEVLEVNAWYRRDS